MSSTGRFAMRGRAFLGRAFRPWGLAGAETQNPSAAGWIARVADRLSVTKPQDRLWIARKDNG